MKVAFLIGSLTVLMISDSKQLYDSAMFRGESEVHFLYFIQIFLFV